LGRELREKNGRGKNQSLQDPSIVLNGVKGGWNCKVKRKEKKRGSYGKARILVWVRWIKKRRKVIELNTS